MKVMICILAKALYKHFSLNDLYDKNISTKELSYFNKHIKVRTSCKKGKKHTQVNYSGNKGRNKVRGEQRLMKFKVALITFRKLFTHRL